MRAYARIFYISRKPRTQNASPTHRSASECGDEWIHTRITHLLRVIRSVFTRALLTRADKGNPARSDSGGRGGGHLIFYPQTHPLALHTSPILYTYDSQTLSPPTHTQIECTATTTRPSARRSTIFCALTTLRRPTASGPRISLVTEAQNSLLYLKRK